MESNGCCSCSPFVSLFLGQLLDFGYNCGSLISEAFGLFKTFQKISAPPSFTISFTPECSQMFLWAKNIIDKITFIANTIPLTDFENFSLYTLIIPVTILMYWSFIVTPNFYLYCIVYGIFLTLGVGFSFIGISFIIPFVLISFSSIVIIIGISLRFCECAMCCSCFQIFSKRDEDDIDLIHDIEMPTILFGFGPTFLIFYLLMIPTMISRNRLTIVISVLFSILTVIYFILFLIINCWLKISEVPNVCTKLISFMTNILSLLIIPSTEKFIDLMKGPYSNNWRCILSYISLSLLLPLAITLLNIFSSHQSISKKYNNKRKFHYYIELIDIAKQLLYAIFAGYDIIWGCLFLEIAWATFILIIRPYNDLSEYTLTIGNSIVPCISNSTILYLNYQKSNRINFPISLIYMILNIITK